jgi:hypothetical protein
MGTRYEIHNDRGEKLREPRSCPEVLGSNERLSIQTYVSYLSQTVVEDTGPYPTEIFYMDTWALISHEYTPEKPYILITVKGPTLENVLRLHSECVRRVGGKVIRIPSIEDILPSIEGAWNRIRWLLRWLAGKE